MEIREDAENNKAKLENKKRRSYNINKRIINVELEYGSHTFVNNLILLPVKQYRKYNLFKYSYMINNKQLPYMLLCLTTLI